MVYFLQPYAAFVAFETDCVVRYEMTAATPSFRLGEGEEAAVLGFTTAGI